MRLESVLTGYSPYALQSGTPFFFTLLCTWEAASGLHHWGLSPSGFCFGLREEEGTRGHLPCIPAIPSCRGSSHLLQPGYSELLLVLVPVSPGVVVTPYTGYCQSWRLYHPLLISLNPALLVDYPFLRLCHVPAYTLFVLTRIVVDTDALGPHYGSCETRRSTQGAILLASC